jgi:hypothetical protein
MFSMAKSLDGWKEILVLKGEYAAWIIGFDTDGSFDLILEAISVIDSTYVKCKNFSIDSSMVSSHV